MKFAHGLLLALAGLASYFILSLLLGVYQRYPFAHMLLTLTGIGVMIIKMKNNFSFAKLGALLFSLTALVVFVWWSQSYSTYGAPAQSFGEHETSAIPNFILKTTEGADFDFNAALKNAKRTLLVFNRGVW